MARFPDTRASLILKLASTQDTLAWNEFARLYQPVVYRLARRRGFQHADAEELVQEVMVSVARAVDRWVPDAKRGRFRDWLHQIARNLMINFLTRRKYQVWGTGDSGIQRILEEAPDANPALEETFELEYRREVFSAAARNVQQAVSASTWQAFELSAIDGLPIDETAARLRLSIGNVYIARSRVMARLRVEVQRMEQMDVEAPSRV
jgi:RNA polymerase sigma-70 factor (ECF subfamily)